MLESMHTREVGLRSLYKKNRDDNVALRMHSPTVFVSRFVVTLHDAVIGLNYEAVS